MDLFVYKIVLMIYTSMWYIDNTRVLGQTYHNMTNLQSILLTNYSASVRPVQNQSDILNINITITVYKMVSVDVVRGTYEIGLHVFATWQDEHMVWNPEEYGGINQTTFDLTHVFYPKLMLANSLDIQLLSKDFMTVTYNYDGSAFFDPGDMVLLTCVFHMKYWPFDKQICYISLVVYGFHSHQVNMYANNPAVMTSHFVQGGEWWVDVNSFQSKTDKTYYMTQLHYKFKMNRRPTYYILTIILPIASLGLLTGLAFFLPSDADTRVNYTMSIMLSLAVFLGVISGDIPRGSESVPIFCVFLLAGIIACALITVILIGNARIFVRSNDIPVSMFYRKLVQLTKLRDNKVDVQQLREDNTGKVLSIHGITDKEETINDEAHIVKQTEAGVDTKVSWQDVSLAIDMVVVAIFIPMVIVSATILLTCCAVMSDYDDHKAPF